MRRLLPPPRRLCTVLLCATSAHAALTYQETCKGGLSPAFLCK